MTKTLFDSSGLAVALPTSPEEARRHRYPHYDSGQPCPRCVADGHTGMISRKRYVDNGRCVHCAKLEALTLRGLAEDPESRRYLCENGSKYGPEFVAAVKHTETLFNSEVFPVTRDKAVIAGEKYFMTDNQCPRRGHLGIKTLTGRCYHCEEEANALSPRQEAIRSGAKWYLPVDPCARCGLIAEKRVDNGQCRGCLGGGDGRSTPDSVMMSECPDMIISRKDAVALGLKVFRTGEPCHRGHRAYRYVSTSGCVSCQRQA